MLNFSISKKHEPKCHVTHGIMGHLDAKQAPVKKKPFSAILSHNFVQRIELIMPEELFPTLEHKISKYDNSLNYSRVILPLQALVERDFFTKYIKKGNILMLSEGRIGAENVYLLKDGKLSLHLDRKSYETAGLVGRPDSVKVGKDLKSRWLVELDLRQPSMLHGKKGFDRVVYAFKNVLINPVTWLFCDLDPDSLTPDPLSKHFPVIKTVKSQITRDRNVTMPSLRPPLQKEPGFETEFHYYVMELHEWFSLVMLNSPRIYRDDEIDPVLSRYYPSGETTETKITRVIWRGFIPPAWAHKLFVDMLLATKREMWFALNVSGFPEALLGECKDCMVLKLPGDSKEYVLWEIL